MESGEEDWEEDRETEKKKGVGGGGKERRVLAPWARQRKKDDEKRDWVVKVDEWGRQALQQWVVPLQGAVVSDSCS